MSKTSMSAKTGIEQGYDLFSLAKSLVPLESLSEGHLNFLLNQRSQVEYLCKEQVFFEAGVYDYRHIYLLSGQVRLVYPSGHEDVLSAGDTCYPLVNEMPRVCRLQAESDCTLLIVESENLDKIVSWSQIADYMLSELSQDRDLDEDIEWIKTVLKSNLFCKVPPVNAEQVLEHMQTKLVHKGEVIVRQGEIGDCCYFIKEGSAEVTARSESGEVTVLAEIGYGRCFGEDALVYETFRNATVTMTSDGVLMCLNKDDFKLLLLEPGVDEIDENEYRQLGESPVYVDVRTQGEYEQGHLSMSANVPLSLFSMKRRLLSPSQAYIFYCDSGRRSRAATFLMAKQGIRCRSLRGGLIGAGMQYQLVENESYVLKNGVPQKGE